MVVFQAVFEAPEVVFEEIKDAPDGFKDAPEVFPAVFETVKHDYRNTRSESE